MPVRCTSQSSFFTPTFLDPNCVVPGTVPWLLWKEGDTLLPRWMASEWRGSETTTRSAGRAAWPARVLFALHTLRWSADGCSRLGACRRAKTDLAWRAAMGLDVGSGTPSEATMREFEAWLRARSTGCGVHRYLLLHEHVARLALAGTDRPMVVAVDSTPMWCFGALRGTIRLLGDGLRGLARRLARELELPLTVLARRWSTPWLTARSMKGGMASIDWRSPEARASATDGIVRAVLASIEDARKQISKLPEARRQGLLDRCVALVKVITDDLEEDAEGRLVVARKVASDRIVSITDPEARSGRKTRSQPFKGYRLHVLGDVVSGIIMAVEVVPANTHDARVGESLIGRARALIPRLHQVLGDTAYGATDVRVRLATLGIDLVAPPQMPAKDETKSQRKALFDIDFETRIATCPMGVESTRYTLGPDGQLARLYWPRSVCAPCPMRASCTPRTRSADEPPRTMGRPPRTGRRLILHRDERALRDARAVWNTPERRELYKRRVECELLIAKAIRAGGRKARAWGLGAANLQAHSIAMHVNLAVLAGQHPKE